MEEELEIEGYEEYKAHEEIKKDDLSAVAGQKKGGRDRLYSSSEIIPKNEEQKIIQDTYPYTKSNSVSVPLTHLSTFMDKWIFGEILCKVTGASQVSK